MVGRRYTPDPPDNHGDTPVFKTIRVTSSAGRGGLTVIGVQAGVKTPPPVAGMAARTRAALAEALRTPGFRADAGEIAPAGRDHLLIGLGDADTLDENTLRKVGARLIRRLDRIAPKHVTLHVAGPLRGTDVGAERAGSLLGEGIGLANWRVDAWDGDAANTSKPHAALSIMTPDEAMRRGMEHGLALAECVNDARVLGATPPNVCNPPWLATRVRALAKSTGLRCRVITWTQAREMGMGGIVNVGKGSANKPCLIVLEHRPARVAAAAKGVHLALVGKSITFDTGGYSLKISGTMKGMKYDKCGGMAVIGAMLALARLKARCR